MSFNIVLLKIGDHQFIILEKDLRSKEIAEQHRKNWRRVLGNKNWIINRRPGLDTILGLTVVDDIGIQRMRERAKEYYQDIIAMFPEGAENQ